MKGSFWFVNLSSAVILLFSLGMGYNEDPDGKAGVNGSPGEQTCAKSNCHNSFSLNSGNGSVTISSNDLINWNYMPGQTYNISVTVEQPGIDLFGFGFEALASDGTNAGTLVAGTGSHAVNANVSGNSRRTLTQTQNSGITLNSHTWNFTWIAPSTGMEVTFYAVGNAANGNGGRTGDYIYSTSQVLTFTTSLPDAPTISGGDNDTICEGSVVELAVASQPGVNVDWYNQQDVLMGTGNSISIGVAGCYRAVASNAAGSVNSLNEVCITVTSIDNSVSQSLDHLTANQSGAQYQWLDCLDGGNSIANAQGQSFYPQVPGSYAVQLDFNGCSVTSSCMDYLISSINDFLWLDPVLIFPNPASSFVTVNSIGLSSVDIYNPVGQKVFSSHSLQSNHHIPLEGFSSGVYEVMVFTGQAREIRRLVIK